MREYPDDFEFSTFEELDAKPEPEGSSRRRYWRELLLGLMLIAGVLGWSGWQWWHQQTIQQHYVLAQDAMGHLDLDTALKEYTAAGEYRDASSRTIQLTKDITERDTQYAAARKALTNQQWAAALKAIKAVNEVHPNYRNTATLRLEAERHVYRDSIAGSIARRTKAPLPGLYYRSSAGWLPLEASDQWSGIRGVGDVHHVVYDVPGPGWSPPVGKPAQSDQSTTSSPWPELTGRKLMAVTIDNDNLTFEPLSFDPAEFQVYTWGDKGVWALRQHDYTTNSQMSSSRLPNYSSYYDLAYEAFGDAVTRTVQLPSPEWFITDMSTDAQHLLLAHISSTGPAQSLHLSGPGGYDRRLVYTTTGQITVAEVSPDGRYVLAGAETLVGGYPYSHRELTLIDAVTGQRHVIAEENVRPESSFSGFSTRTVFVTGGAFSGKLVVLRPSGEGVELQILDPADPGKPALQVPLGALPREALEAMGTTVFVTGSAGNKLLFAMQSTAGVNPYSMGGSTMFVLQANTGGRAITTTLGLGPGERLSEVQVVGDYLVYGTTGRNNSNGAGSSTTYGVQSLPLSRLTGGEGDATTLLMGSTAADASIWNGSYVAGPRLLSYLQGNQLRVRSYDGSIDVALENGLDQLYDPDRYHNQFWLR